MKPESTQRGGTITVRRVSICTSLNIPNNKVCNKAIEFMLVKLKASFTVIFPPTVKPDQYMLNVYLYLDAHELINNVKGRGCHSRTDDPSVSTILLPTTTFFDLLVQLKLVLVNRLAPGEN